MEPRVHVGIIAGEAPPYPFGRWWLSARGIYITLRNTAGYLYALAFRVPEKNGPAP